MKIERKKLITALKNIKRCVKQNAIISICKSVLIDDDGVKVTDLESYMVNVLNISEFSDSVVVDHKLLLKILSKIDDKFIIIEQNDMRATINNEFEIDAQNLDDFPLNIPFDMETAKNIGCVSNKNLAFLLDTKISDIRSFTQGVAFVKGTAITTNITKLHVIKISDEAGDLLLPKSILEKVKGVSNYYNIFLDENNGIFCVGCVGTGIKIYAKAMECVPPDYMEAINVASEINCVVDRKKMMGLFKKAEVMLDFDHVSVCIDINNSDIEVSVHNPDIGDMLPRKLSTVKFSETDDFVDFTGGIFNCFDILCFLKYSSSVYISLSFSKYSLIMKDNDRTAVSMRMM